MYNFKIGDRFTIRRSKNTTETVTLDDIYTTTNTSGEIVNISYICSKDLCGQKLTMSLPGASLARGIKI